MLKVSTAEHCWEGETLELNVTFDVLREYQWARLLGALWSYPGMTGPLASRYYPGQPLPEKLEVTVPEPTATLSLFGALDMAEGVRVGVEVLVTRSLFECISVLIPHRMFDDVQPVPTDPGVQAVEKLYYHLAVALYEKAIFSIATIGINRGCQLMIELISEPRQREAFLSQGNFMARDDVLIGLKVAPRQYQEVMPSLRWCPPKSNGS